jgi:transcription initiation factor TFIID TATA-box-binding protein
MASTAVATASPRVPELQIKYVCPLPLSMYHAALDLTRSCYRNYVSSANLGLRFDLANVVVKSHRKAEFGPKKNCLIMKLSSAHEPRATAMLFANGKLVCTGANTEDGIKSAARKFTQLIQKMDYAGVNLIDFKIQNVVASCLLGFRVLLEELSFAHSDACTVRAENMVFQNLFYDGD